MYGRCGLRLSNPLLDFVEIGQGDHCIRIVVMSDTHEEFDAANVPDGDLFIHCGDFCNFKSNSSQVKIFNEQLGRLPHALKIVVAGNHETSLVGLSMEEKNLLLSNCVYLENSGIDIGGCTIFGCPHTPQRSFIYGAQAFSLPQDEMNSVFRHKIPENTSLLITHLPPLTILDEVPGAPETPSTFQGSSALLSRVRELKFLKLHLFGHCHDSPGVVRDEQQDVVFINAAQKFAPQPYLIDFRSEMEFRFPKH